MSGGSAALAGKRGLIVDDEFLIALDLEQTLQAAGAEIICAGRVSEALDLLRRTPALDFAILDMHLGSETSLPVAAELMARQVPFVFLSGLGRSDANLRQFPQALVVAKPFHGPKLVEIIAGALAKG